MQRYEDVPEQSNLETLGPGKAAWLSGRWPFLAITVIFTWTSLACDFMGTGAQSIAEISRLPTLTQTPLPTLTPTAGSPPLEPPLPAELVVTSAAQTASLPPPASVTSPVPTPPGALPDNDAPTAMPIIEETGGEAVFTALVGLNVRDGPGLDYLVIGQLVSGQSTQVTGKTPEGTWWQIVYPPGGDSLGWVSADIQYSTVKTGGEIQIAQLPSPPPPTATPASPPTLQPTQLSEPTSTPATQPTQTDIPANEDMSEPTESPEPTGTLATQPTQTDVATGEPTTEPTPTPTSETPGLAVASVRVYPDQDEGGLLLYGDMINNTDDPQELAYVTGDFYDGEGEIIADEDSTYDYWPVAIIPPNGRVPFELTVGGIDEAADFDLRVEAEPIDETPRQDFEFSDVDQWEDDGAYCVEGRLRNPGDELESYLLIALILYDSEGNVINFGDYEEFDPGEVEGDETSKFEICVGPPNEDVDRHELRAWGL